MANEDGIPLNFKESNRVHGYIQELKSKQIESTESFVSGRDTFVSLSTGYGKSVILVEVVSVVFQQRPHISDLDSDILASLASNVHSYMVLNRSRTLINTH